jgi:hypothetical protein
MNIEMKYDESPIQIRIYHTKYQSQYKAPISVKIQSPHLDIKYLSQYEVSTME